MAMFPEQPPSPDGTPRAPVALTGELAGIQLGERIGRGPVGTSYAGWREGQGPVVVKVLTRRFEPFPELVQEVLADLRRWLGFQHPHAAAPLALGQVEGRQAVVYGLAPGRPLEAVLAEQGALPPALALQVVEQLAQALAAGAARGPGCGDVRAAKVQLDPARGQATLLDLGLARAACLAQGFGRHGLAFGHPAYLAPEVLQERLVAPTPACDVYALGILLYQLLSGGLPFRGDPGELLRAQLERPLPPPPRLAGLSVGLAELVHAMTAKDPRRRLGDPGAVLAALARLRATPAGSAPAPALRAEAAQAAPEWSEENVLRAPPRAAPLDLQASLEEPAGALPPTDEEVTVGRLLGRGKLGRTYEGRLQGHDGPVAVKVIATAIARQPELLTRLVERARRALPLDDPHLVRTLRVVQGAVRTFVVQEAVPGGRSLRRALEERGRFEASAALAVVEDLARALLAAGAVGLSHGDLRPETVFLEPGGRARLADLGLAEAASLAAGFGEHGVPYGHPRYLAPEVLQERRSEPDPRGDVYALGILLWELLAGRPPFQGKSPRQELLAQLKAPLPDLPEGVSPPAPVLELALRLSAKLPALRPAGPTEVLEALARCRKQVELGAGASAPVVEELSFDGTRRWEDLRLDEDRPDSWSRELLENAPRVGPQGLSSAGLSAGLLSSEALVPVLAPAGRSLAAGPGRARRRWLLGGAALLVLLLALVLIQGERGPDAAVRRGPGRGGTPPAAGQAPGDQGPAGNRPPRVLEGTEHWRWDLRRGRRAANDAAPRVYRFASKQERLAAVAEALARHEQTVADLRERKRFREALEAEQELPGFLLEEAYARQRVEQLQAELSLLAAGHRHEQLRELQAELARNDLSAAERRLAELAELLPREELRVLRDRLQRARPLLELARAVGTEGADLTRARTGLAKQTQGRLELYAGGALELSYPRADDALLRDLTVVVGPEARLAEVAGRPGVHLAGSRERPVLAALRLPVRRLLDAELEVVLVEPGRTAGRSLFLGCGSLRPPRAYGVSWGAQPAFLAAGRKGLRVSAQRASPSPPPPPALVPLTLVLRIDPAVREGDPRAIVTAGSLELPGEKALHGPRGIPCSPDWLRGHLLIYADVELYVTAVRLRGLLDLERL